MEDLRLPLASSPGRDHLPQSADDSRQYYTFAFPAVTNIILDDCLLVPDNIKVESRAVSAFPAHLSIDFVLGFHLSIYRNAQGWRFAAVPFARPTSILLYQAPPLDVLPISVSRLAQYVSTPQHSTISRHLQLYDITAAQVPIVVLVLP